MCFCIFHECHSQIHILNFVPNSLTPMKMAALYPHIGDYFMDSTPECSLKSFHEDKYIYTGSHYSPGCQFPSKDFCLLPIWQRFAFPLNILPLAHPAKINLRPILPHLRHLLALSSLKMTVELSQLLINV